MLVSPTTLTFQDKNGDLATVTISKPLFNASNVNKIFTFDTGSVNGSNGTAQQLELLNITKLGQAAHGMDIAITATPVESSPGIVNVGFINASGIDLGNVSVAGDLGRIAAGDISAHALKSLTVESMGAQGISTQKSGGNLNTKIAGGVGSITINGDFDSASVGIGGGPLGLLGSLTITGNLNGGAANYAGSIRTQGGITNVQIDGSINGSGGMDSGLIGTAGKIGTVVIDGSISGGFGEFSGSILSTKTMLSVTVEGDINGGTGANTGEIGTASSLGTVFIGGSVTGGNGPLSGVILATENIAQVTITGTLSDAGGGAGAGEIGAGGNLGILTLGGMDYGSEIHARQNIQSIIVDNPDGSGIVGSTILVDKGSIDSISATGGSDDGDFGILNTTITVAGNIGSITANDSGPGFAMYLTDVTAGSIGVISATSGGGTAICISNFTAKGAIGNITATGGPNTDNTSGIVNSVFQAGGSIGSITASGVLGSDSGGMPEAISNSGFNAGGGIGAINATGVIDSSVFIAGINLGSSFNSNGAGGFGSDANFGFGGNKTAVAAQIGNISASLIEASTFLSGVHGAGPDGQLGTRDDSVGAGSSIGTITSAGGLNDVWIESGNIGATNSGEIVNSTYLSTDAGVTSGGIGPITVTVTLPGGEQPLVAHSVPQELAGGISGDNSHGIYNSSFISNAGIGPVNVTVNGVRGSGENGGISGTTFQAGHALGSITVTNNGSGSAGSNYGIIDTTFSAGLDGYGAVGDISVTLTDSGPDGNSAGIIGVNIDASVCSCMSANMGSISVENADTDPTAQGIVDSVFRTHGNIGPISATMDGGDPSAGAIVGSTFSAYGSIGDINVYGAVTGDNNGPSRFLAGYDIGSDMTFGNEDLSAKSLALQGGQSIGDVTVTGYFEGSDIIASINPGAGYVFGGNGSTNTNVGAGGTIGLVTIGSNVTVGSSPFVSDYATSHAIEAANYASDSENPTATAFGYTDYIPVVLYVDGGANDVRITNLTLETF
ncbi:MAG TPA: hypothetical protein VHY22_15600 [Chthoniobacteraceae bacterium]|nr:hypothetical protein [Chthoniobacteraceae bacterium]